MPPPQVLSKALESAQELVKDFNRQDTQVGMDIKHVKQKLKKAAEKMEAGEANAQVGIFQCGGKGKGRGTQRQ